MAINDLPTEILHNILTRAVSANGTNEVRFTYGLRSSFEARSSKVDRYVRSPSRDDFVAMDAAQAIRRVCTRWGSWVVCHTFQHIREQRPVGNERWADLTSCRAKYPLYELVDAPRGTIVKRDPHLNLRKTYKLLTQSSAVSQHVRRLWFDGFHTVTTDGWILSLAQACPNLEILTIPWTVLRRGRPEHWVALLKSTTSDGRALRSLEVRSSHLTVDEAHQLDRTNVSDPLRDPRVSFRRLRRLRLSGDTRGSPVTDNDLLAIAKTATNLRSLQVTGSSTITVHGVMAVAKASDQSLRLLEYRPLPLATDKVWHLPADEEAHDCSILSALPRLVEFDISLPSVCAKLFANPASIWRGTCTVRSDRVCSRMHKDKSQDEAQRLEQLLRSARLRLSERARLRGPLMIEIIHAGLRFRPDQSLVHDVPSSMVAMMNGDTDNMETRWANENKPASELDKLGYVVVHESSLLRAMSEKRFIL